jgi:predicted permease
LAPGATLEGARAELAASAARAAAATPATHRHRRAQVLPYTRTALGMNWREATAMMYSINASVVLFLLLVCANVATLVFARTATRESELVVRTALGASRGRIVMQLFTEALVLGAVAAVAGLAAASFALRWGMGLFESLEGELPFWMSAGLSPWTVLYTLVLTTLAAVVAGVVPGRKATGREVQSRLRQGGVGAGSPRFGRLWTGIIVTQVALTAAFVPIVMDTGLDTDEIQKADTGLAADEFLSVRLEMDRESPAGTLSDEELGARTAMTLGELKRRLEAEPGVLGVTAGSQLPGGYHPRRVIQIDGEAAPLGDEAERKVQTASVDPGYFQVLGAPIVLGRGFHPADLQDGQRVVIVNQSFAREVLGGRSPVGRRVRYAAAPEDGEPTPVTEDAGPWYEIVGVSGELTMTVDPDLPHNAGIYHPAARDGGDPIHMAVHLRGDPESFAPRLRALATAVDPSLRLYEIRSLDQAQRETLLTYTFWLKIAGVACGIVLLLSILGIYSILSFTVARRTREIGIRVALGADRRRIVGAIFARAFKQVGLGIAIGAGLLVLIGGGIHSMYGLRLIASGMALMVAATIVACIVPTRRALGVEPTEAMRADV